MTKLVTAEDAFNFWAPEGARIDHLLKALDDLLPTIGEDQPAITDETRQDVEEALGQARLAMDTILGAYARVLHGERSAINQYQQPGGVPVVAQRNNQGGYPAGRGWPQQQ